MGLGGMGLKFTISTETRETEGQTEKSVQTHGFRTQRMDTANGNYTNKGLVTPGRGPGVTGAENAALFHKRVVEAQGFSQFWVRMEVKSMAGW